MNRPAPRELYITADDFGRDQDINSAVQIAHESGILSAASLMVTGGAWRQAVRMARAMPRLDVGLHLVLSNGQAALPPEEIPRLVDRRGRFSDWPTLAGVNYWISRDARRQLRREIDAQFERFASTGLSLAHVDGHQNMHLHPVVFDIVLPLAQRCGARRIRVPHDNLRLALRFDRSRLVGNILTAGIFSLLERRSRAHMAGSSMAAPRNGYGLLMSGQMTESYVLEILGQLDDQSAEIYFHPTIGNRREKLGPNRGDLDTLVSERVRKLVAERFSSDGVFSEDRA
ncbi:MAG TPA: hopanoid biosynthesis-associated protein HpnK [Tepidisphaeraceae bacterium]|nr:hopanoid biosynthesis-associated protein HpnK [Tepidisphaeraceae bacterium]